MNSVKDQVWKILDNNPCIRINLSRGLLNSRALAKYIQKEKKLNASIDAIISSIRRYPVKKSNEIFTKSSDILSKATISTKSRIANIALVKDTEIQSLLPQLFSMIHYNRGDVLRIIQADESMKVLVDEKNLERIQKLFTDKKIIKIDKDIAEINMHLNPEAVNTPGIAGIITNELALNGINIMEIISCVPEMLFFVNEKDILKAHQVLYRLCHQKK